MTHYFNSRIKIIKIMWCCIMSPLSLAILCSSRTILLSICRIIILFMFLCFHFKFCLLPSHFMLIYFNHILFVQDHNNNHIILLLSLFMFSKNILILVYHVSKYFITKICISGSA